MPEYCKPGLYKDLIEDKIEYWKDKRKVINEIRESDNKQPYYTTMPERFQEYEKKKLEKQKNNQEKAYNYTFKPDVKPKHGTDFKEYFEKEQRKFFNQLLQRKKAINENLQRKSTKPIPFNLSVSANNRHGTKSDEKNNAVVCCQPSIPEFDNGEESGKSNREVANDGFVFETFRAEGEKKPRQFILTSEQHPKTHSIDPHPHKQYVIKKPGPKKDDYKKILYSKPKNVYIPRKREKIQKKTVDQPVVKEEPVKPENTIEEVLYVYKPSDYLHHRSLPKEIITRNVLMGRDETKNYDLNKTDTQARKRDRAAIIMEEAGI